VARFRSDVLKHLSAGENSMRGKKNHVSKLKIDDQERDPYHTYEIEITYVIKFNNP